MSKVALAELNMSGTSDFVHLKKIGELFEDRNVVVRDDLKSERARHLYQPIIGTKPFIDLTFGFESWYEEKLATAQTSFPPERLRKMGAVQRWLCLQATETPSLGEVSGMCLHHFS